MGNIGAAVSQKGYEVKDSADRLKVFSSSFQTLKVFDTYSVSTTIPAAGNVNTITITHNLGFFAPFLVVYNGSTTIGQGTGYFMADKTNYPLYDNDSYSGLRMYENTLEIKVDEYFDEAYSSTGDTVYFTVYIFLDNFSTISEENIDTSDTVGTEEDNYGLRVSKDNFDVKTTADENCVLSSSFFNALVHKKGTQVYTDGYTISHNLGYVPSYMAFVKESGKSYITANPYSQYVSNTTLTYDSSEVSGATFYYIIFKDKIV